MRNVSPWPMLALPRFENLHRLPNLRHLLIGDETVTTSIFHTRLPESNHRKLYGFPEQSVNAPQKNSRPRCPQDG